MVSLKITSRLNEREGERSSRVQRKLYDAEEVKELLGGTRYEQFSKVGVVEWLPFPGLASAFSGDRPPREFRFVGRSEYDAVCSAILRNSEDLAGVLIIGPKGSGKSCILRAIAVEFFARPDIPENFKPVCVWYFDARKDLAAQIRDSLFFTYSDAGDDVIAGIGAIRLPEDLATFLQQREAAGELVVAILDGQEKFDSKGQQDARLWLDVLERYANFTVKALSPGANDASKHPDRFRVYPLQTLFSQVQYDAFLKLTLLGRVLDNHPGRKDEVKFLAGVHPMSLFCLNKACEEYTQRFIQPETTLRFGFDLSSKKRPRSEVPEGADEAEIYLDSADDWNNAVAQFKKNPAFCFIREQVESYGKQLDDLKHPASVFRGYVLGNGNFCTDYLYLVHLEAALLKLKSGVYRSPSFLAYVKEKLRRPTIIWPEIGWALEGFVADAVMAGGLMFQGRKIMPVELRALEDPMEALNAEQFHKDRPVFMLPGKYSYKYIDALIIFVDDSWVAHALAVQVTVRPETHQKTEYKFMAQAQASSCFRGKWIWHYVYIVPDEKPPAVQQRKPTAGQHQQQPKVLMVDYTSHELQMSECFTNLGHEENDVLRRLGRLRYKEVQRRAAWKKDRRSDYEERMKSLPLEKQKVLSYAKKQPGGAKKYLVELATSHGIKDPSKRTIYELLDAMNILVTGNVV